MKYAITTLAVCLAAALTAPAFAVDKPIMELARIAKGEQARLDIGSVERRGPEARFEISVDWRSGAAPQEYMPRRVRYVADCTEGKMAVAAVAVAPVTGQASSVLETRIVPPSSAKWFAPKQGSEEAHWMSYACTNAVG